MGLKHNVLFLNGPNKGQEVEVEEPYTEEEEQKKIDGMKFVVDGKHYAGYCRTCGRAIRQEDATYLSNVDGRGVLYVDAYHRYCL